MVLHPHSDRHQIILQFQHLFSELVREGHRQKKANEQQRNDFDCSHCWQGKTPINCARPATGCTRACDIDGVTIAAEIVGKMVLLARPGRCFRGQ